MKPRVAIFVLCGRERSDWINPALFLSLQHLRDERYDITIDVAYDLKPYERARNFCVVQARNRGFDYLVQIDNDMEPPANFANLLHEVITSGKAAVGLKAGAICDDGCLAMLSWHDNGRIEGSFRRTGLVGSGVLIISSEVWKKIPGPWFRWLVNDDEQGTRKMSEDYYFCELVQQHGLEVWTHTDAAGHLKTLNVTRVCQTLGRDKCKL